MMNGFNQYICDFCQQPCRRFASAKQYGNKFKWQKCQTCPIEILYAVHPTGIIRAIMFNITNKGNIYQLIINKKSEKTEINYLKPYSVSYNGQPKTHYYHETLLTLDSCVNGVTPQNVLEKIKLYILFS